MFFLSLLVGRNSRWRCYSAGSLGFHSERDSLGNSRLNWMSMLSRHGRWKRVKYWWLTPDLNTGAAHILLHPTGFPWNFQKRLGNGNNECKIQLFQSQQSRNSTVLVQETSPRYEFKWKAIQLLFISFKMKMLSKLAFSSHKVCERCFGKDFLSFHALRMTFSFSRS